MCMSIRFGMVGFWMAFLASIKRLIGWPVLSAAMQEISRYDNVHLTWLQHVGGMSSTVKSMLSSDSLEIFRTGEIQSTSNGFRMQSEPCTPSTAEIATIKSLLSPLYSQPLVTEADSSCSVEHVRSTPMYFLR